MKFIKVKFTCFWEDEKELFKSMVKLAGNSTIWKNLEIVSDDKYDFLIIFTKPHINTVVENLNKSILFLTEPVGSLHLTYKETPPVTPMNLWLPTWGNIPAEQHNKIINLTPIEKKEKISSVTSELYSDNPQMEGYFQRLRFIHYLDKIFGEELKLWGRPTSGALFKKLNSYRGEIKNKYDALFNFQYHFACENSFLPNYFTEKIVDPILAESLCFYDGCTNLENFIDKRAFIKLDLTKPELSAERIQKAILDNEWSKKIEFIRNQKTRFLTEMHPLNIVWMAIHGKDILQECMNTSY